MSLHKDATVQDVKFMSDQAIPEIIGQARDEQHQRAHEQIFHCALYTLLDKAALHNCFVAYLHVTDCAPHISGTTLVYLYRLKDTHIHYHPDPAGHNPKHLVCEPVVPACVLFVIKGIVMIHNAVKVSVNFSGKVLAFDSAAVRSFRWLIVLLRPM